MKSTGIRGLAAACCLAVCVCGLTAVADALPGTAADEPAGLRELLTQRRDVLQHVVRIAEEEYLVAGVSLRELVAARDELLQAELALADGADERQTILQTRRDNMLDLEERIVESFRLGHVSQREVLRVRAARLQAEIDLLRG